MTYTEFKEAITKTTLTEETYYSNIIEHRNEILLDIAKNNQTIVAKALNMSQSKLSAIIMVLKYL